MTYPKALVDFLLYNQGIALLVLLILVLCTTVARSFKQKLFFAALLSAYGIVAFLILISIITH